MKRNGFTLVELLAVLVVLALVALIVTPNVAQSIKDYQDRLYDVQIDGIKDSAKNWLADQIDQGNTSNIPKEGTPVLVTVRTLQAGGYADPELKDPRNKKAFNANYCVKIDFQNNQYIYTFQERNC